MKKIILLLVMAIGLVVNLSAQTNTTPDGVEPNPGNCNLTGNNGPSSCPKLCVNKFSVTPAGPGQYLVRFVFFNVTGGNKNLLVEIKCGVTVLVFECISLAAVNTNVEYYKDYTVTCANLSSLIVTLTPYTGNNCGGGNCAPAIRSIAGSPLPVKLHSFTATRNQSKVLLNWETAQEVNNKGFIIEKNENGGNYWKVVSFVSTKAINGGNSDVALKYSYEDINHNKGVTQYRIRQIDLDLTATISDIRQVRGEGQSGKISVFPNPSKDGTVNIVFDASSNRSISVYDMSGREVKQIKNITGNNLKVENLKPGMYTLNVIDNGTGEQMIQKIVVNN